MNGRSSAKIYVVSHCGSFANILCVQLFIFSFDGQAMDHCFEDRVGGTGEGVVRGGNVVLTQGAMPRAADDFVCCY